MINGTGPHRMILDTGAGVCQISPRVAKESGIKRAGSVRTVDAHGRTRREGMGIASQIQIGAFSGEGVPLTIDELPELIASDGDIVGVIGYNLFAITRLLSIIHSSGCM